MKSKNADFWAELERETAETIAELDKLLAASEDEDKAFLASLEAEPMPELDFEPL